MTTFFCRGTRRQRKIQRDSPFKYQLFLLEISATIPQSEVPQPDLRKVCPGTLLFVERAARRFRRFHLVFHPVIHSQGPWEPLRAIKVRSGGLLLKGASKIRIRYVKQPEIRYEDNTNTRSYDLAVTGFSARPSKGVSGETPVCGQGCAVFSLDAISGGAAKKRCSPTDLFVRGAGLHWVGRGKLGWAGGAAVFRWVGIENVGV